MSIRRLLVAALALVVLVLAGAGAGAWWYLGTLAEPYRGFTGDEVFVEIPPGAGAPAIGRRLVAAGVVRDEQRFRVALWRSGHSRDLKAGEYRFADALPVDAVIARLAAGDVYKRQITFREGLTVVEMARHFAERGFGDEAAFLAAAADPTPIRDLDPDAPDLEGYLFPETYTLARGVPAADVVGEMVGHFKAAYRPELRAAAAAAGLTTRQVVTLASLVEKETARAEERPLVAAVYRNRLRIGMGMQADPTVIYALERAGEWDGNLTRADLQFDSPYNTYRYRGLPPGPIAAPGLASLEAAVAPADVKYLYFVSRNDGSHVFASTLAEHNRNVYEWQVKYFREKRKK
ncbi:MAG: endolytic transglycosylase MltG [Vicinamibacterales bacterium]